jgi:hypothetical protein
MEFEIISNGESSNGGINSINSIDDSSTDINNITVSATKDTWSNLPKKDIEKILNYIPKYFRKNLRFINKHWNKEASGFLIPSYSLIKESESSYIINKYGNNFIKFDNLGADFWKLMRLTPYEIGGLRTLKWKLITDDDLEALQFILKTCNKVNFIYFRDEEEEINPFTAFRVTRWGHLISDLIDYPALEGVFINFKCAHLHPLVNILPLLSLKQYNLKLNSNHLNQCSEVIKKSQYLNSLQIEFKHYDNELNYKYLVDFFDVSGPLGSKLEYFKLLIKDPKVQNVNTFRDHLKSLLTGIFTNPNLSSLRTLNLNLGNCGLDLDYGILQGPITDPCLSWSRLTKLSLFAADEYLMGHIFDNCQNLKELSFGSALVLPFDASITDTKPMSYLTKLSFKGFHTNLINQGHLVQHLFPNVVTLALHLSHSQSLSIAMDAYYIPLLFTTLTRVILSSEEYSLEKFASSWTTDLSWKEFYLTISSANRHLLSPILAKLPELEHLYINHGYLDTKVGRGDLGPCKAKVYSALRVPELEFEFRVGKKLTIH